MQGPRLSTLTDDYHWFVPLVFIDIRRATYKMKDQGLRCFFTNRVGAEVVEKVLLELPQKETMKSITAVPGYTDKERQIYGSFGRTISKCSRMLRRFYAGL